jgi:hypothetical protein
VLSPCSSFGNFATFTATGADKEQKAMAVL